MACFTIIKIKGGGAQVIVYIQWYCSVDCTNHPRSLGLFIADAPSGCSLYMMMIERLHTFWAHSFGNFVGDWSILFMANKYAMFPIECSLSLFSEGFPRESLLICGSKGVLTLLIIEILHMLVTFEIATFYTNHISLGVASFLSVWQQVLSTQCLVLVSDSISTHRDHTAWQFIGTQNWSTSNAITVPCFTSLVWRGSGNGLA